MENKSLLYPCASAARRVISLDGMWRFEFDPESNGMDAGWDVGLPKPISMPVPASFCDFFTDKESREYCGDFWYETDFFVPGEWSGKDVAIRFGSVTHRARVFVNGVEVVNHEGGFLPFDANVTEIVRYNQYNKLTVLANNELNEYMLPAGQTNTLSNGKKVAAPYFDFYNYAGIHRPVKLLALPKERVLDFEVTHRLVDGGAEVDYTVTTNGSHDVTVEVLDGTTKVAEASGKTGTLKITNAKLWNVHAAYLYNFVIRITDGHAVIDEYFDKIGIRTFEVKDGHFLLNGKPVYLRGFGKHEDSDIRGRGLDLATVKQTHRNIHFKTPTDSYAAMFDQMIADGVISTRGLKADAVKYGELIFDVNSAYFHNHGGYEYAKQFYTDAYKAAVEIVGGEQYILSAVMHADERNRAMSEALGQDVYHYHLHVVYVPVVEKQILWSKRCKDKSLVGTVKETIMQVSRSKKWESKVALDEQGNPLLTSKGKKVLRTSYSVLQDDFFNYMKAAGYTDVERGERGSTEEHLTVTQFKVQAEQQRLEAVTGQVAQAEQSLEDAKAATEKQKKKLEALQKETKAAKAIALTVQDIEAMGKKATFGNNITLTPDECDTLKRYATNGILFHAENERLKGKLESAQKSASIWKQRCEEANKKYQELKQKAQPFLDALEIASEKVRAFINSILARGKETQEHKAPARKRGQDMEI